MIKIIFFPIKKNKTEVSFFYSIGPKIGTSVAPPSRESTDHGLIKGGVHILQGGGQVNPFSDHHNDMDNQHQNNTYTHGYSRSGSKKVKKKSQKKSKLND